MLHPNPNPPGLIVCCVFLEVIAILCLTLRFYTRYWMTAPILVSDWCIGAAKVFGTGLTVMQIYGISIRAIGYRLHTTILDPSSTINPQITIAKKITFALWVLSVPALGLIKISACLLYWRIFAKVIFRRALIIWTAVIVAWTIVFTSTALFQCGTHIGAFFGSPWGFREFCKPSIPNGWAYVISDAVTDLVTLGIPIPLIFTLQLSRARKLLVSATFLVGALAVGASTAKAYIFLNSVQNRGTQDGLMHLTGISMCNLIEVQVGTIAACGMSLRPILSRAYAKLVRRENSTKTKLSGSREIWGTGRREDDGDSDVKLVERRSGGTDQGLDFEVEMIACRRDDGGSNV